MDYFTTIAIKALECVKDIGCETTPTLTLTDVKYTVALR
jgi:hypothetical protein